MRIDDVNKAVEAFQQLSYQDMDAATKSVNDLFRLLLKRDKFYVIGQTPDIMRASVQETSAREYLRVFTHQELAAKQGEPTKITSLELCRLCRHWFCRGIPGLIVNDGAVWWMMPLNTVLKLFADMVGGDAPDPAVVEVISLYYDILYGEGNAPLSCNGAFAYPKEGLDSDWTPATLEQLLHADSEIVTPEGRTIPASQVCGITAYLATLDKGDQVYDYNGLDLIPPESEPGKDTEPEAEEKKERRFKLPELPKLPRLENKKLWLSALGVGAIVIFLIVLLCFVRDSGTSRFNKALRAGDYQKAQTEYLNFTKSQQNRADETLADLPAALVQQYAADELSEAELMAHLSSIYMFPSAADEVEVAVEAAAQLTASKKAYKTGGQAESTSEKLRAWQGVIEADIGSWEPMHKDVTTNESNYVAQVTSEIQNCRDCGLDGHAYALSQTLVYWYPWNIKAKTTANDLAKYAELPDIAVPVEIKEVKTSIPSTVNKVDLSILWSNASSKPIEKIVFFVTPLDEFGSKVAKPFKAIDTKGYQPGEGVSSTNWGWAGAWRSATIKNAVVTRVSVTFEGGFAQEFSL